MSSPSKDSSKRDGKGGMPKALNAIAVSIPQPSPFFQYTAICECVIHYLRNGPMKEDQSLKQFLQNCHTLCKEKSKENQQDHLRDPQSLEQTIQSIHRFSKVIRPTESTVCQGSNKRQDGLTTVKSLFSKELYFTSVHKEGHFRAIVLKRGHRSALVIFPSDFSERKITHVFYPGESTGRDGAKTEKNTRPSYASLEGLRNCQEHLLRLFGVIGAGLCHEDVVDPSEFKATVLRRNKRQPKKESDENSHCLDEDKLHNAPSPEHSGCPTGGNSFTDSPPNFRNKSSMQSKQPSDTQPITGSTEEHQYLFSVSERGGKASTGKHAVAQSNGTTEVTEPDGQALNPQAAELIHELFRSEVEYVKHLQELQHKYAARLSPNSGIVDGGKTADSSQNLSPPEHQLLLSHIPDLLEAHERLEDSLHESVFGSELSNLSTEDLCSPEYAKYVQLGSTANVMAEFARAYGHLYEQYIGYSSLIISLVRWFKSRREELYKVIQSLAGSSSSPSLESLVMMPLQRVPRYLLLLKDLSRKLPGVSPARGVLQDAIHAFDRTTRDGEAASTAILHQCALMSVEARLRPPPVPSLTEVEHNKLLFEGYINKFDRNRKSKTYYCFITNGHLIYGSPQENTFAGGRNSNFGTDLDAHSRLKADVFLSEMKTMHPAISDRSTKLSDDLVAQRNSITVYNAFDFANHKWLGTAFKLDQLPEKVSLLSKDELKHCFYIRGHPKSCVFRPTDPKDRKICKDALEAAILQNPDTFESSPGDFDDESDYENHSNAVGNSVEGKPVQEENHTAGKKPVQDENHTAEEKPVQEENHTAEEKPVQEENHTADEKDREYEALELELQRRRKDLQRRHKTASGESKNAVHRNAQTALKTIFGKERYENTPVNTTGHAVNDNRVQISGQEQAPVEAISSLHISNAGAGSYDDPQTQEPVSSRKTKPPSTAFVVKPDEGSISERAQEEKPLSSVYSDWKQARRSSLRRTSADNNAAQVPKHEVTTVEEKKTNRPESRTRPESTDSARQSMVRASSTPREHRSSVVRPASVPSEDKLGASGMARHASNKNRVTNSLKTVCLAGPQNKQRLQEALDAIKGAPDPSNFVVLFRSTESLLYKALYRYNPQENYITRIHGKGPQHIAATNSRIRKFLKYNTGSRAFEDLPTKQITVTTDGICIAQNPKGIVESNQ